MSEYIMRILPRLIENILFCTLLYFLIYKNKLFVRKSFRNLEEHVFKWLLAALFTFTYSIRRTCMYT